MLFPDSSVGKESACNAGDPGPIPGLGRSPEEVKGDPLQCSGLENSMGCIVHRVAKSRTQLRNFQFHFPTSPLCPRTRSRSNLKSWLTLFTRAMRARGRQRTLPKRPVLETEFQEQEPRAQPLNQSFFFLSLNWSVSWVSCKNINNPSHSKVLLHPLLKEVCRVCPFYRWRIRVSKG